MKYAIRYILVAASLAVLACGDSPSNSGAPSTDASGGDAPASSDGICHDACANVARCRDQYVAPTDQAACRTQCAKELSGEGFLNRDVATVLFEDLASKTTAECGIVFHSTGWGFGVFRVPDGAVYQRLASREAILACARKQGELCEGDPELLWPCLEDIYRYRASTVARTEPCLSRPAPPTEDKCKAMYDCIRENTDIKGQPWLGPGVTDEIR